MVAARARDSRSIHDGEGEGFESGSGFGRICVAVHIGEELRLPRERREKRMVLEGKTVG